MGLPGVLKGYGRASRGITPVCLSAEGKAASCALVPRSPPPAPVPAIALSSPLLLWFLARLPVSRERAWGEDSWRLATATRSFLRAKYPSWRESRWCSSLGLGVTERKRDRLLLAAADSRPPDADAGAGADADDAASFEPAAPPL